ncbi:MAG: hypothetical protein P8N43_11145 [Alphaproteobacteria bacterium]|nr:hypothetical protein [Alphaproteobacteria bacterium]
MVSANPRGLDFMIRHGIKGAVGGGAAALSDGPIQAYRDAAARAGQDLKLGENLTIGLFFHLADTKEQAVAEMTPFYEEHIKMFGPLGFVPGLTPEQVKVTQGRGGWYEAGVPDLQHFMDIGAWFAGTSDELIERLKTLEERYPGMELINLSCSLGTPEAVMLEQYQRLAEDVMPHFGRRA